MVGMSRIGDKFSEGKAFIPELLMSAKGYECRNGLFKAIF